jgi:hypothetical protein
MKKLLLSSFVFMLLSCEDGIDDAISKYQTSPKSQELVGFWQLKGTYPPIKTWQNHDVAVFFNGYLGIGHQEILFLDNDYLRFLNIASTNGDTIYQFNGVNKFHWYNQGNFIMALHQSQYNSSNYQNIQEYQFPYKFGTTKDTLILQCNGKILYLLKKIDVKYKEYNIN